MFAQPSGMELVTQEGACRCVDYRHARDIPDRTFLAAVEETIRRRCQADGFPHSCATRWDLAYTLGRLPYSPQPFDDVPGVPMKVVLAKFRRVKNRGLIDGCDCGCRGDFELTDLGRALLTREANA